MKNYARFVHAMRLMDEGKSIGHIERYLEMDRDTFMAGNSQALWTAPHGRALQSA